LLKSGGELMRTLIVDNVTYRSYSLKGRLENLGHEIVISKEYDDALKKYENLQPNYLILSSQFGESIQLLEKIKHDFHSKLIVVSLSEGIKRWEGIAPYLKAQWNHQYDWLSRFEWCDETKINDVIS
jgi:CheY-like chemotaxis protein